MRKMLILGALPLPFEGTWVPLGSGVWMCDFLPEMSGKVRLEVEDLEGNIQAHILQEQVEVFGKKARIVILEEIDCDGCVHIGVTRVR